MKVVNQPIMKKDAMALVTGKPVFTNDKAPKECLIMKLQNRLKSYTVVLLLSPLLFLGSLNGETGRKSVKELFIVQKIGVHVLVSKDCPHHIYYKQ